MDHNKVAKNFLGRSPNLNGRFCVQIYEANNNLQNIDGGLQGLAIKTNRDKNLIFYHDNR